jgi:hypothetical protein
LARSTLRSALTLARAFFEIPALSSHAVSASSHCVSSSSYMRRSSCNSSITIAAGVTAVGLGGGGGGLHKANVDKPIMHQETSSATGRNGQNPTFLQRAPNGRPLPSSSTEVVATHCFGWNPRPYGASHDHHHGPSL